MDLIKYYPQTDHLLQDQEGKEEREITIELNTMFMNLLYSRYFMRGTTYVTYDKLDSIVLKFRNENVEFCLVNELMHGTFVKDGVMKYNRGHLLSYESVSIKMRLEKDIIVELSLNDKEQDPTRFSYYIVSGQVYLIFKSRNHQKKEAEEHEGSKSEV